MSGTAIIDERFHGPPGSANGGYACALAARPIAGAAEVTLRVPPPLSRPLRIVQEDDRVLMTDGEVLVAEARPASVELDVPAPVSLVQAERATVAYPWRDAHPYPTCFVCGPQREVGDGLCIFPGPVEGRPLFAAPWIPDATLANPGGLVHEEFVWAALDCPTGIVTDLFGDVGLILLGRLAVDISGPVVAGAPHVVQAWTLARDGRKLRTASAVFTADGDLLAVAQAVWIELRRED